MKIYGLIILLTAMPSCYSMKKKESITKREAIFRSYLPTPSAGYDYYQEVFIREHVENIPLDKYQLLKKYALPIAQKTSETMGRTLTKMSSNDPSYPVIYNLKNNLDDAIKKWNEDERFHPLLFLQYNKNSKDWLF